MTRKITGLVLLLALIGSQAARAAVPQSFSVQGVLRDANGNLVGGATSTTVTVIANFYANQTGGTALNAQPVTFSSVAVSGGLFTINITSALFPDMQSVLANPTVYLEMQVNTVVYPRQLVTPDVYALMCGTADNAKNASNATNLGGQPASYYVDTATGQSITGAKTFSGFVSIVGNVQYTDPNSSGAIYYAGIGAGNGDNNFRIMYGDTRNGLLGLSVAPTGSVQTSGTVGIATAPITNAYLDIPIASANAESIMIGSQNDVASGHYADIVIAQPTSDTRSFIELYYNKTRVAYIDPTIAQWSTSSDLRLKTNVKTIEHALDKILSLRGVTFDWKSSGKSSLGVIAQDVEKAFPALVSTDSGGIKSVAYANLVGALIEATRELKQGGDRAVATLTADQQRMVAENKALAEKNAALANRLDRVTSANTVLMARLQRLENAVDELAVASRKSGERLAVK